MLRGLLVPQAGLIEQTLGQGKVYDLDGLSGLLSKCSDLRVFR